MGGWGGVGRGWRWRGGGGGFAKVFFGPAPTPSHLNVRGRMEMMAYPPPRLEARDIYDVGRASAHWVLLGDTGGRVLAVVGGFVVVGVWVGVGGGRAIRPISPIIWTWRDMRNAECLTLRPTASFGRNIRQPSGSGWLSAMRSFPREIVARRKTEENSTTPAPDHATPIYGSDGYRRGLFSVCYERLTAFAVAMGVSNRAT